MDAHELKQYENRMVELVFLNGHAVRAKLVTVDVYLPQELVYDVKEVLALGGLDANLVKPGIVAAADPAELRSCRLLD